MQSRERSASLARLWFGLTSVAVLTGLVWQLVLQVQGVNVLIGPTGQLPGLGTRMVRYFSFFTVESNILVAGIALTLALDPRRDGTWWRMLRLQGLFGITITGVVYRSLLHGIVDLHGAAAVTNALLHYVSPIMAILGWLVFGPRPRFTESILLASLSWPALYVAWILAHGAATNWYPYPFVDVKTLGYPTVLRNGVGLTLVMVGCGALYLWLDHHLPSTDRRRPAEGVHRRETV
ncbi:MAG: Pr6Pr family membrane protein [Actinomycetota bacterium]|nr:Pr6Pr family membrane protein [Actinomycetota bacterium]